jgi:thioredoxin reductase (NADPH)
MPEAFYDCIIVGGGPAGLSAAVYMGRFLRKTLVLDAGEGRSSFEQVNDNYLGFPNGVKVKELRELGRQQAQRFGVEFEDCQVDRLECHENGRHFRAFTDGGEYAGRTVILCTGVCDIWPDLPDVLEYVGKTLFWCITCDGFRTFDKAIVCFGRDDEAATTALQFLTYTKRITFVTAPGKLDCSNEKIQDLEEHGIEMMEGEPERVSGTPDRMEAVVLKDGRRLPCDVMFSLLGCRPNNKLAQDVGVKCSPGGYVIVDEEGYTNVPGFFCAGDLSKMHTHQVVSAAHEGAEAAQTANYYLYADYQKE